MEQTRTDESKQEQARTGYESESLAVFQETIKATDEVISGDSKEAWYEPENPLTKDQIAGIESQLKACGFHRVRPTDGKYSPLTDGGLTTYFVMKNDNLDVVAGLVVYKKCEDPQFKVVKI